MAFGLGEEPRRSCGAVLASVTYPVGRAQLVEAAGDGEETVEQGPPGATRHP